MFVGPAILDSGRAEDAARARPKCVTNRTWKCANTSALMLCPRNRLGAFFGRAPSCPMQERQAHQVLGTRAQQA
eukprot:4267988-Pyramimonas_sp.AAC.1